MGALFISNTHDDTNKDPQVAAWDEVDAMLKSMPKSKQGRLYQTLHNLGWRISTVESEIKRAWKEENA